MNNDNLLNEIARSKQLIGFNYSINEQRTKSFRILKGRRLILKRGEGQKTLNIGSKNYTPSTPETDWDTFLSNDSQMVSLMDNTSKKNWTKLKSDTTNKSYAVASLEEFNNTYPDYKWDGVNVSSKKQIKTEIVPTEPKKYPAVPLKFPADLKPSSDFFVDNYYETTDLFKQSVQTDIIEPITAQLSDINLPEGEPKAFLNSLVVSTSCSRVPNTKSPDGKTYDFATLSQLRNQKAREYIISELQKIGVVVNEQTKITTNWKGSNNDGTSGPEWTGKMSDKPNYEQYKYLDAEVEVIFNQVEKPSEEKKQDFVKIESDLYDITFIKKGTEDVYIRLPKIFGFLKKSKRKSKKGIRPMECALFQK